MKENETPSRSDQLLDLLLDALAERQRDREVKQDITTRPGQVQPSRLAPAHVQPAPESGPVRDETQPDRGALPAAGDAEAHEDTPVPDATPAPRGQFSRTLGRLALLLLILTVAVNIPFNRHGVSLARAMPDSAALIIRDGLLLKTEDGSEIYVLEDEKLRWITSLEAFHRLGYRWQDVHVVEQNFLDQFEMGRLKSVLFKCDSSPHIYRIEREQKRWIKDIDTFVTEGHVWDDVYLVSCGFLRNLPDGPPIPPEAGPPPQP